MIFVDTNIFMYAAGTPSTQKEGSVRFLDALARSPSIQDHCINTEVLQEILHRYRSIGRGELGFRLFDAIMNLGITVHPIELEDLRLARVLLQNTATLSTRDAVHAGMMQRRGVKIIVTYDNHFRSISDVEVVTP